MLPKIQFTKACMGTAFFAFLIRRGIQNFALNAEFITSVKRVMLYVWSRKFTQMELTCLFMRVWQSEKIILLPEEIDTYPFCWHIAPIVDCRSYNITLTLKCYMIILGMSESEVFHYSWNFISSSMICQYKHYWIIILFSSGIVGLDSLSQIQYAFISEQDFLHIFCEVSHLLILFSSIRKSMGTVVCMLEQSIGASANCFMMRNYVTHPTLVLDYFSWQDLIICGGVSRN